MLQAAAARDALANELGSTAGAFSERTASFTLG